MLKENLHDKKTKGTLIFDYAKLRDAIPKVWMENLKDSNSLLIPTITVGQKEKHIQLLSSKCFYSILINEKYFAEGPQYWTNILNSDTNWKVVFQRNLRGIKENKLKQFNFKLLYNLLPVKIKLFIWQLSNTDTCEPCACREDLNHAFLTCKMNVSFFTKLQHLIKHVYDKDLQIDSFLLLKIQKETNLDDILTIAFWSIYKMIILRNETGKEERNERLWYMFLKELKTRLDTNNAFVKIGKKKLYRLPDALNLYV